MAKKGFIDLKYFSDEREYPEKRYNVIKKAVIAVIKKFQPEDNISFNLKKIVDLPGTRGWLRGYLKGDFHDEDKCAFINIIQELIRDDKFLLNIGGRRYVRLK